MTLIVCAQFDPAAVARNLGVGDWGAPPPQVEL